MHKYTIEALFEFTCSKCNCLWEMESSYPKPPQQVFCPHCGKEDRTINAIDPLLTITNQVESKPKGEISRPRIMAD